MSLQGEQAQRTGPPECYGIYMETKDDNDIMNSRETRCPALVWRNGSRKMASTESWKYTQGVNLRRLNEGNPPTIAFEDQPLLWWDVGQR